MILFHRFKGLYPLFNFARLLWAYYSIMLSIPYLPSFKLDKNMEELVNQKKITLQQIFTDKRYRSCYKFYKEGVVLIPFCLLKHWHDSKRPDNLSTGNSISENRM